MPLAYNDTAYKIKCQLCKSGILDIRHQNNNKSLKKYARGSCGCKIDSPHNQAIFDEAPENSAAGSESAKIDEPTEKSKAIKAENKAEKSAGKADEPKKNTADTKLIMPADKNKAAGAVDASKAGGAPWWEL